MAATVGSPWAVRSDRELVDLLFTEGDQLPLEFAREVTCRGERIVPLLAELVGHPCHWHRQDAGWCATLHATYLLGAIGGEAVVGPLLDALRIAEEYEHGVAEDLPAIFASLGPGVLEPLREIASDADEEWMLRHTAMASMAAVTVRNPEHEAEVFRLIGHIAADQAEDDDVRAWAGKVLLDFARREHKDLLRSLVDAGITEGLFGKWEIRKGLIWPRAHAYTRDWMDFYKPEKLADRRLKRERARLDEGAAWKEVVSRPWGDDPAGGPCDEDGDGHLEHSDHADPDEDDESPEPASPPHAALIMEQMSFNVSRLLAAQEFKSSAERAEFMRSLRGRVEPPPPRNSWESAQDIMYEAWQEPNPRKRVSAARRALALCPDCSDALLLLAEEAAESEREYRDLLEKAVGAATRALGPSRMEEDAGHFWSVVETRPYMRARAALADLLLEEGEVESAISHLRELLRLDPADHQGNRYDLVAALGRLGRFEEAESVLEDSHYAEDCSISWLCLKAVTAFARQGPSAQARRLLKAMIAANPHLPDYLLGRRSLPERLPKLVAPRSAEEAMWCATDYKPAWERATAALDWLRESLGPATSEAASQSAKVGRNDPCPCGSGQKFKKCCLDRTAGHA